MKTSNTAKLTIAAFAFTFAFAAPAVFADDKKDDKKTDHPAAGHFASAAEAWTAAQDGMKEMGDLITAKKLKSVHEAEVKVVAALKGLGANSAMVEGDKKKRLDAALAQAAKLADSTHDAADDGQQAKTEAEFKKLQGSLKLIEAQYPAGALTK